MGLLTVPTCRSFLSVARSFVHCMDGWVIHGFLIIIHGQCPWTTSLSSMGDSVIHEPYSCSRTFLSLLGWFLISSALLDMDDPYGRIGDELISRYPISLHVPFVYLKKKSSIAFLNPLFFIFISFNERDMLSLPVISYSFYGHLLYLLDL